eukprot:Gb_24630 [translate_table: standard]
MVNIFELSTHTYVLRCAKYFQAQLWNPKMQLHVAGNRIATLTIVTDAFKREPANKRKDGLNYEGTRSLSGDVVSWTSLISRYAQNGRIVDARQVFDRMPYRNVVSWTAMIAGYAQNRRIEDACHMFDKMPERNTVSWNAMIAGFVQNGRIEQARHMFDKMPKRNVASWNAMLTGYIQDGRLEEAGELFDKMTERNMLSWTALIAGYAQNGHSKEALIFFNQMQHAGVRPDQSTLASVISACTALIALEQGEQIHTSVIKKGFDSNVFVVSALVTMYAKCGNIDSAFHLFAKTPERNVVLCTAMITGYSQNARMKDALRVFEKMSERNVVSWTAMIAGYVHNGHGEEALKLFSQMQQTGTKPNQSTYTSIIGACANQAALEHGQQVHAHIIKTGFESNVFVCSALVAMYAKCGSIDESSQVFCKINEPNVVLWNAMIAGYAQHGHGKDALQLFQQMQHMGLKPNHITFVGVLSACSHAGLVDEGWHYFNSMSQDHCTTPRLDHYGCMVDILGRARHLNEAIDFIGNMPFEPDVVLWGALLGACRIHMNMELGELAAKHIFKLEPENAAAYVVLSNIYAGSGRWSDASKLRIMRKARGVKKNPGCCWIVVSKMVHTFLVGDRSHPQTEKIYAMLERLSGQLEKAGYMPDKNFLLHDVEEELKEDILPYHSEKLAIAFGLISTPSGMPLRIMKNLRVCGDCHTATKFISLIVGREIVLRDSSRFHHFKDGLCSCDDYW